MLVYVENWKLWLIISVFKRFEIEKLSFLSPPSKSEKLTGITNSSFWKNKGINSYFFIFFSISNYFVAGCFFLSRKRNSKIFYLWHCYDRCWNIMGVISSCFLGFMGWGNFDRDCCSVVYKLFQSLFRWELDNPF